MKGISMSKNSNSGLLDIAKGRKFIRNKTNSTTGAKYLSIDALATVMPIGLQDVFKMAMLGKLTAVADCSQAFNLLVPNSRSYFKNIPKIQTDLNKFVLVDNINISTASATKMLETKDKLIDTQDGLLFIDNNRDIYLLEDLMTKLFMSESIYENLSEQERRDQALTLYKPIQALIMNFVTTAQGAAPKEEIISDDAALASLSQEIAASKAPIALDIETDGLDPHTNNILGIGLALDGTRGVYIPLAFPKIQHKINFGRGSLPEPKSLCSATAVNAFVKDVLAKKKLIAHNAKFEYQFFKTHYAVSLDIPHDTMVAEYILDCRLKRRYNLGDSVKERFPLIEEWKESKEFITNLRSVPISKVASYCIRDCCNEYLLFMAQFHPLLRDFKYLTYSVDMPFIKILAEAELQGFAVDEAYLKALHQSLNEKVVEMSATLQTHIGDVNPDSAPQLRKLLFEKLGLEPTKFTSSGVPSVDAETLKQLQTKHKNEILDLILERRSVKKLASTYTLSFLEKRNSATGNIHPSFMNTDTETGRLSCRDPNFQNLPSSASDLIRKAIIAPDNCALIFADYSGQELRILAAACRDEALLRAYNPCYKCPNIHDKYKCPKITPSIGNPDYCRPTDVHSLVASKVFASKIGSTPVWEISKQHKALRNIAKAVNFLLVYGGAEPTLAARTGITLAEAEAIFKEYFGAFPGIHSWIRKMYNFALNHGYSQDVLGRRRYYDVLQSRDYRSDACPFYMAPYADETLRIRGLKKGSGHYGNVMSAMRRAQNHPIQGSAAEMTKQGALFAQERFDGLSYWASIIGFVHDEIITLCPKNKDRILETIEVVRQAMTKDIPIYERYGFPDCLTMEIGIEVGDNWGGAMSVEEYLDSF